MKEFMQNRATLLQKMAELREQNPSTNGAPNPHIFAEFQEQNAELLKRQRELAQIVGRQQDKGPLPTPTPLQIPPNTSPQVQSYLTARNQLLRDQIAYINQHRNDDPQTRMTAMQQWRQQNAPRFAQVQQMAQAMAQASQANSANGANAAASISPADPVISVNPTKAN